MPIEGFSDSDRINQVTKWLNPTPYVRKVRICMEGVWRTVRWEPGETVELPAIYDRAVQIVFCQEDECNGRGHGAIKCQPCTRAHKGQIMGGQDPLLVRVGRGDVPNVSLDPDEVERQAEAEEARKVTATQKALTAAMLEAQATAPPPAKGRKQADAS